MKIVLLCLFLALATAKHMKSHLKKSNKNIDNVTLNDYFVKT